MQIRQFIAGALVVGVTGTALSQAVNTDESSHLSGNEYTINNAHISSETRSALRLENAVSRTLSQNPELYQYQFREQGLAAQRQVGALSPAIQLDIEVENVGGSGDFRALDSAETTIALSSVIELGDKARSRVAVVDARSDRLNYERQAATLDVLGELATLYIRALSTQENIALAEETAALSERMRNTVEERVSRGAAPEAELMRADAALSRATIQLQSLKASFERQKVGLSRFWGDMNPDFGELTGDLMTFDRASDFSNLFQRAKQSPAIAIFASEARLKEAQVELAQAQSRVDVGWQLGVRRFEETSDTAFTAGVSIPLFSGKRNQGAVASALAERNAVEYQEMDALLQLHNQLFTAFSQRQENKAAVEQFDAQVLPALERALDLTEQAYESGRYRYQDWIVAQEELLAAKQQRIEAATAAQLSQVLIEQLISEPLQANGLLN